MGGLIYVQSSARKSKLAVFVIAERKHGIALNQEALIMSGKYAIGGNFQLSEFEYTSLFYYPELSILVRTAYEYFIVFGEN